MSWLIIRKCEWKPRARSTALLPSACTRQLDFSLLGAINPCRPYVAEKLTPGGVGRMFLREHLEGAARCNRYVFLELTQRCWQQIPHGADFRTTLAFPNNAFFGRLNTMSVRLVYREAYGGNEPGSIEPGSSPGWHERINLFEALCDCSLILASIRQFEKLLQLKNL